MSYAGWPRSGSCTCLASRTGRPAQPGDIAVSTAAKIFELSDTIASHGPGVAGSPVDWAAEPSGAPKRVGGQGVSAALPSKRSRDHEHPGTRRTPRSCRQIRELGATAVPFRARTTPRPSELHAKSRCHRRGAAFVDQVFARTLKVSRRRGDRARRARSTRLLQATVSRVERARARASP